VVRKLLLLPLLLAGLVGLSHGQPPGFGDRGERRMMFGGGGGPPDPDRIWQFIGKGQDSINLNDPANAMMKSRMERDGTPIPANGILTKDMFRANFQQRMAQMSQTGGTPGGPPPAFAGGSSRGFDPSTMTDDQVRGFMRSYDTDGDGRISKAEALAGRSDTMKERFDLYDANRDGFMDLAEYRAYNVGRFQERMQQSSGGSPAAPPPVFQPQPVPGQPMPGQPVPGQPASDEPARPEVLRYGKLPKGAPTWMLAPTNSNKDGLDADRDGQIGLYEWRRAGKRTAEFVEKDLNGDGYLTYTEWKTYEERQAEKRKLEDDPDAAANPPAAAPTPPASSDRDRGRDRNRDRGSDGRPQRNPFQNGGKRD
jgi:Ca2+-binding EF-hand superfamily protein